MAQPSLWTAAPAEGSSSRLGSTADNTTKRITPTPLQTKEAIMIDPPLHPQPRINSIVDQGIPVLRKSSD
jgi:hypothetical protein